MDIFLTEIFSCDKYFSKDIKIHRLWVSVGDHSNRKQDSHEKIIQAAKIIIHPEYNYNNFHNDIGEQENDYDKTETKYLHFV